MRRRVRSVAGASLEEIERVYRERAVEFERVAAAIVRDRELARDVVQDAFATVVRKRASFARRGSLDAWVWRTVLTTALNRRRAMQRQPSNQLSRLAARNGRASEAGLEESLLAEIASLPERQRLVVFLRYYADLDYTSIGAALGISSGTVGSTLNSAHQALRRQLHQEERHA
jgi:RNA polymerase sigma factor (sigma-70 family)